MTKKMNQDLEISTKTITIIYKFIRSSQAKAIIDFFKCMIICHTAFSSFQKTGKKGSFISESMDEVALLTAAK